ncbi:7TM diverse intracellular signalling [Paenibacillus sp. UNCCL117]|uniref:ATP-binding protein n=1 Tax=unclassified Paenibacillus TaxID=185978 RepID=UPI00088677C6|nr:MULTISPECIES: ATP-binding protein [unclassified Paenibacillus]SDE66099.1 7TM diverse intracellular signalling [Paenibacillus sp. cl123]SFW70326.1 7TM diverse intracellular signalling [Paenibacillus sp. UNCCL117]
MIIPAPQPQPLRERLPFIVFGALPALLLLIGFIYAVTYNHVKHGDYRLTDLRTTADWSFHLGDLPLTNGSPAAHSLELTDTDWLPLDMSKEAATLIPPRYTGYFWMRVTLPEKLRVPEASLYVNRLKHVQIWTDQRLIYSFNMEPRQLFVNKYIHWGLEPLQPEDFGQTLYIRAYQSDPDRVNGVFLIGRASDFILNMLNQDVLRFVLSVVFLGMSISAFLMFALNRKEPVYGYFGLLTACSAYASIVRALSVQWFMDIPLFAYMQDVALPLGTGALLAFLSELYPRDLKRQLLLFARLLWGYGCLVIAGAMVSESWYDPLIVYGFTGIVIFVMSVVITRLARSYRTNKDGDTLWIFAGLVLLVLFALLHNVQMNVFGYAAWLEDFLPKTTAILNGMQISIGIFLFVLCLGAVLLRRLTRAHRQARQYAEKLGRKNEMLQDMDRLKDNFLARTSHELRTPLYGIAGMAESLLDKDSSPLAQEETHRRIGLILASSRRLTRLVNDLLDLSRLTYHDLKLVRRPVDLLQTAQIVTEMLQRQAEEKGLTLVCSLPADLPYVYADEDRVEQILFNLIGNAIKFTERGGITLSASVFMTGTLREAGARQTSGVRAGVTDGSMENAVNEPTDHAMPRATDSAAHEPTDHAMPRATDSAAHEPTDRAAHGAIDRVTPPITNGAATGVKTAAAAAPLPWTEIPHTAADEEAGVHVGAHPGESADHPALIVLSVTDTGVGIPENELPLVFERFSQAEHTSRMKAGGAGLGLTISRQLARLHGGELSVESVVGQGSIFRLTLPVCPAEHLGAGISDDQPGVSEPHPADTGGSSGSWTHAAARTNVFAAEPLESGYGLAAAGSDEGDGSDSGADSGKLILVVDDEPINVEVIASHLSSFYRVVRFFRASEALQWLADARIKPDLVIADVMMPGMNGFELVRRIRESYSEADVPILLLTAKGLIEDLEDGFETGANDYLIKPVSKRELLARVRLHLKVAAFTHTLEDEVRQRTSELENRNQELRQSMHETMNALEEVVALEERNRIAHEIHDIVGHTLTATIMQIEATKRLLNKEDKALAMEKLSSAQTLVREGLRQIRTVVLMLKDDAVKPQLKDALTELIEQTSRHAEVQIGYRIHPLPELPPLWNKVIFHALQEGLTNGLRHGHSTAFDFELALTDGIVHFSLRNNGLPRLGVPFGFGLSAMSERIAHLGGTLELLDCQGSQQSGAALPWNCELRLTLPWEQDDAE